MKKIKINTKIIAILVLMVVVLYGCGGDAENAPAVDEVLAPAEEVADEAADLVQAVPAPGVDPNTVDEMIVEDSGEDLIEDTPHEDEALAEPETKEFIVTAKKWEFVPSELNVNKGDHVIIRIKSIDVTHGFVLSAFGINEQLESGKELTLDFIADKSGEFNFFCNVFCGSGHGGMRGKLIVS